MSRILSPTWHLTKRALVQFPRIPPLLVLTMLPPLVMFLLFGTIFGTLPETLPTFPTDNYYEYLAPGIVFLATMIGVGNAGMALIRDLRTGYFRKLMLAPINKWAILLGRLLADGIRVYVQAGLILLLSLAFGATVETGIAGALVMLLVSTLFSLFTVGVIVVNFGLRTKNEEAVQSFLPLYFTVTFLTTAFLPKASIESDIVKAVIAANPAQYVVRAMHKLMFVGWDWSAVLVALGITAAGLALGMVITYWNWQSVYD